SLPSDERDPLGKPSSVLSILKRNGTDIDTDISLRKKYSISSREFNPRLFLRDTRSDASLEELEEALVYLNNQMSEGSEALRYLIEDNYEKFVKSKSALDSVYGLIVGDGGAAEKAWTIDPIKTLVDEATSKAALAMKPVIDNKAKEIKVKLFAQQMRQRASLFDLPARMLYHIRNNDHDSLIRDYRKGKDSISKESITSPSNTVNEGIWSRVEAVIDNYRKDTWQRLAEATPDKDYGQLMRKLLELGIEDNPIKEWIYAQNLKLEKELTDQFDLIRLTMELLRQNIMAVPHSSISVFTAYAASPQICSFDNRDICDSPEIIEMWLAVRNFAETIGKSAYKIGQFWKSCTGFLTGQTQYGWHDESQNYLSFTDYEIKEINGLIKSLVALLSESVTEFFQSSPQFTSKITKQLSEDIASGKVSDSYFFLPPYANSLSTLRYLGQSISILASSFNELSSLQISPQAYNDLGNMLGFIREKCLGAIFFTWQHDSSLFSSLEDWNHSAVNSGCTNMPILIKNYQISMVKGIYTLMYLPGEQVGSSLLIMPQPSSKLIGDLQEQFDLTNRVIVNGLMELVDTSSTKVSQQINNNTELSPRAQFEALGKLSFDESNDQHIEHGSKMLLVLSNLTELSSKVFPDLYKLFEKNFISAVQYDSTEVEQFKSKLFVDYISSRRATISEVVRDGITSNHSIWALDGAPTGVSNYINICLLMLVIIHSRVLETSPDLVHGILSALQNHALLSMLESFRHVESFGKGGCLQAVADLEFFRVTMASFQNDESQYNIELIVEAIRSSSTDQDTWNNNGPWTEIEGLLSKC
ncbi:hypothetical protein NADFUDRAFT_12886, partial [Nadsonia fulvescens var. elongata DSM 6958]